MTVIETTPPTSLRGLDLTPRGAVHPSPESWRDQVLYFLLPDRFSDEAKDIRPAYDWRDPSRFKIPDGQRAEWREAGKGFVGGRLKGIQNRLGYLKELGVTALWIGPVWRQRKDIATYHGYAIQNFLDVDSRFGTRQDLRDLVDAAHDEGLYVILDIVYNHTGDNWFYCVDGQPTSTAPYRFRPPHPFHGWRSETGACIRTADELGSEDGVWPRELQNPDWYVRAGAIQNWDAAHWEDPLHDDNEFRRGDVFSLKKLDLKRQDVLDAMVKIYQYWIAFSDCDGYRIDSLKHVPRSASRMFSARMHEFAEKIGKERFFLVGEVAGGDEMAFQFLEIHGRNIDAILDISHAPFELCQMAKGLGAPDSFFALFERHEKLGLHRRTGFYHVSILDDHDMLWRPAKERFAAHNGCGAVHQQVAHAVGVQLTTLGIPCIYYGTEQAFDGSEGRSGEEDSHLDRFVREAMFGGAFGPFATRGCHFFDREHPTYLRIAAIAKVRNGGDRVGMALRRGRQYVRETSVCSAGFTSPRRGQLVAWSRLHDGPEGAQEVLVVLNTHGDGCRHALVTVDKSLHPEGSQMTVLYDGSWDDRQLAAFVGSGTPPPSRPLEVSHRQDRATVDVELPPAGMVILA